MRLGIIRHFDEAAFIYAAAKNLEFVEFNVNHNIEASDFAEKTDDIINWSAKHGVPVGAVGRWGETRLNPDGTVNERGRSADLTLIEATGKLGCPVYNLGVNYAAEKSLDENIELAAAYLNEMVTCGKAHNVKIAVYNCSWSNFIVNPDQWMKILPRVDGLGIKYDPSHAMGRNSDVYAELRDFGRFVYHFHIKGVVRIDGKGYDDPPAGLDMVNWGAVLCMLYTKRYTGGLSIEPHSSKWQGRRGEWGIDYTINHIRPMLMPNELDNLWE